MVKYGIVSYRYNAIYIVTNFCIESCKAILTQTIVTFTSNNELRLFDQIFTKDKFQNKSTQNTLKRHRKAHKCNQVKNIEKHINSHKRHTPAHTVKMVTQISDYIIFFVALLCLPRRACQPSYPAAMSVA